MRGWTGLVFALAVAAQEPAPQGIVRGTFLEFEASGRSGQFSLRTAANTVYRFTFDDKTYVERTRRRASIAGLNRGDALEVVSDQDERRLRYARIVRVIDRTPGDLRPLPRLYGTYHAPTEDIIPRGRLTFAGIVLRKDAESVTLRTPGREVRRILLRPDTKFLRDGLRADAAALAVNTKVFIRASETIEREIEAYQIMWGAILKPRL